MIIIAATMFKMFAVMINITHYVFVMLSWNGEQLMQTGKIHLKCNHMVNINLLDFFEILGISCGHQGKIWDKFFFDLP